VEKRVLSSGTPDLESIQIDLSQLPTNDDFGVDMIGVRLAALFLTRTPAEAQRLLGGFADDDGRLEDLVTRIAATGKQLELFASYCKLALERMKVAGAILDQERRRRERT
jgi:hypothetical protein